MHVWCEGVREAQSEGGGGEQDLTHRRRDPGRVDWMFITPVSDNKASVYSLEYFSRLICVENLPVDMCRASAKSQAFEVNVTENKRSHKNIDNSREEI